MNQEQFLQFWEKKYPGTLPINSLFSLTLKHRWFRIHSLPESKRYANTEEEYAIIMERQNTIINDLIPAHTDIKVVINYIEIDNPLFKKYNFANIGVFVDKDHEIVYQSFMFEIKWQRHTLDDLLRYVADDEMRAFIIADDCLISPYDGGMNLYLKDSETRDFYKKKYKNWLSKREDGM